MTRAQALVRAREVKASHVRQDRMLQGEILSLRSAVASALSSGLNIRLGDIDEEQVPDLKSLHGRIRIYERMVNDPVVRGQIRSITHTMISGVRWSVEGGPSEARDLVSANLLRRGPRRFWCSTSWMDRLYEILGCLDYGFSLFAKVRSLVDGRIIYRDLKWLHPRSVDEDGWIMNGADALLRVQRSYMRPDGTIASREELPAEDLFLVPWDRRGPNWEGNAYIRPFYKGWKFTDLADKIDLIDLQNRGVGIPKAKMGAAGGPAERDRLVEILKSLRGGSKERAFVLLQQDEELGFLTAEGQTKDADPITQRMRSYTALAAGTMALEQTNTASGSRAATSALMTPYFMIVEAIKEQLVDVVNHGAGPMEGLVEELCRLNFGELDEYPRIVGSRVSPTEQLDNVPNILDAVQKGGLTHDLHVENHVRNALGILQLTEDQFASARKDAAAFVPAIGGRPREGNPSDVGQDPRNDSEGRRFGLTSSAEKKTHSGGSPPKRNRACWPWLASTPA